MDKKPEEQKNESEKIPEVTETEKLQSERDDFKNKYLRALADYQNLEKRVADERVEIRKLAQYAVLNRFLPVLDSISKAESFIKDPGLILVKDSFTQILNELGLKELDVQNKEYDPHLAEAIEMVPGKKDNIVVEVLRKGYELNGRVLRPAQVKVSKKVNS